MDRGSPAWGCHPTVGNGVFHPYRSKLENFHP